MRTTKNLITLALLAFLALSLLSSYKIIREGRELRRVNLERCSNETYPPCDARCRGFLDLVFNLNDCPE